MMLALRPTFSESWYRVAGLKAKLRASTQISRQYYRGERWYVMRDPAGNQFHRLSDAAYRFVGLLDGTRTVAEAWELVGGQLDDAAPTQPEVIQILSQLYSANLLEADITPDATVLLRRHKQMVKQKMQGRLMNLLFPRIPLWDCDKFVKRWLPVARVLFSKIGAILWLVVVLAALARLAPAWGALKLGATRAIDPSNWVYLWAVFVLVKLIHELGHAFACRRFGGEVHELGVMFLVFVPTPYVDASSAWAFQSRWSRMFVGAAGMIVELFFAAIMAFVWASTSYETNPLLNGLAYNAMFIASVSTVLFNANPLLRYDGYYILSDFLEIPNLSRKSSEYALGLIKRHVFRVKGTQALPPVKQRAWLLTYAILSTIYRVFVGIVIILVVTYTVPVLGVLMAMGGVVTWLVMPVVKVTKYLALEPELERKRGRAWAFTATVAAVAIILVGVIPFPVRMWVEGMLEPDQREVMRTRYDGFVTEIPARDGQWMKKGQVILMARNTRLDSEILQLRAKIRGLELHRQQSTVTDQAQRQIDEDQIETLSKKLRETLRQKDELTIRAPFEGKLIAPKIEEMEGRYLPRGEQVAVVATMDRLEARVTLPQKDAELAVVFEDRAREIGANQEDPKTEIRLAGDLKAVLHGMGAPVLIDAAQDSLRHPSLGSAGGGEVQTDPRDQKGTKPLVDQFEVRVKVANPELTYLPGQRAYVRFTLYKRPLMWQWGRRFWQMIQTRSSTSKWT